MTSRRVSATRVWFEAGILLVLALVLGAASGAVRRPPVPTHVPEAYFRVLSGARPLLLGPAASLHREGGATFVDARSEALYAAGHIPGALSLPRESLPGALDDAMAWLHGVPIVVYGSATEIHLLNGVAGRLIGEGLGPVSIAVDGFEGWERAGHPIDRGAPMELPSPHDEHGDARGQHGDANHEHPDARDERGDANDQHRDARDEHRVASDDPGASR